MYMSNKQTQGIMTTVKTFTNGKSIFTLENYDWTTGVSIPNGIIFYKAISIEEKRKLHSNGSLHYVYGSGDRKVLKNTPLKRGKVYGKFEVY